MAKALFYIYICIPVNKICKDPCPQVAQSLIGGRETKYVVNYVTHVVNYVLEGKGHGMKTNKW